MMWINAALIYFAVAMELCIRVGTLLGARDAGDE